MGTLCLTKGTITQITVFISILPARDISIMFSFHILNRDYSRKNVALIMYHVVQFYSLLGPHYLVLLIVFISQPPDHLQATHSKYITEDLSGSQYLNLTCLDYTSASAGFHKTV